MLEKIVRCQDAGALGVIVVDDGSCNEDLSNCGRAGGASVGGFAWRDNEIAWRKATVPAVVVSRATGERMKKSMNLQLMRLAGVGDQWVPM